MKNLMTRFVKDQSGATAIEYGLIAALMATAVIAAVGKLNPKMSTAFDTLGTKMQVQ